MSDKTKTLNESTIRRFMSLSGLKPLTETFFDKNETIEEEVEETIEEEVEELDEMGHEAGDRDEEIPMDEPELEEPGLEEPAAEGPVDVEALVKDLADVITTHTGEPIAVSSDEAPEEPPMDDMPMDDMPMDDAAPEEPMMETTEEETVTEETDTDEETVTEETDADEVDEALVAEITRRVAARLEGVSKRENIAEKLAERIFNKLSKKD
jgi:hypothetical protein